MMKSSALFLYTKHNKNSKPKNRMMGNSSSTANQQQKTASLMHPQPDSICKSVLDLSCQISSETGFPFAGTEHVLLAIFSNSESQKLTRNWFFDEDNTDEIRQRLSRGVYDVVKNQQKEKQNSSKQQQFPTAGSFSPSVVRAISIAKQFARKTNQKSFSVDLLFLGILALTIAEEKSTIVSHLLLQMSSSSKQTILHNLFRRIARRENMMKNLFDENENENLKQQLTKLLPPPEVQTEFGFKEVVTVSVDEKNSREQQHSKIPFSAALTMINNNTIPPPPNTSSHWVYPGRLICGESPGLRRETLGELLEAGVNTFISLQESYNEYGCCVDYRETFKKNLTTSKNVNGFLAANNNDETKQHAVEFIHAPIPDHGVVDNKTMIARIEEIRNMITKNDDRVLYIHCFSGHGRTGTVVSALISTLEGIPHHEAMKKLRLLHTSREGCKASGFRCALGRGKLEDWSQDQQSEEIKPVMSRGYKKNK